MTGQKGSIRSVRLVLVFSIAISVFPRMFLGDGAVGWGRLTYYTIQTNLIIGAYWFLAALKPHLNSSKKFEIFRFMSTIAIMITGTLYFIFLHGSYMSTLNEQIQTGRISGFDYGLDMFDTWVNHFTVPIAALLDYIFIKPHVRLEMRHVFSSLVIPLAYFIYHSLRGIITGNFIYSFISPVSLGGWMQVFVMFVVLAAFIIVAAFILFALTAKKAGPQDMESNQYI